MMRWKWSAATSPSGTIAACTLCRADYNERESCSESCWRGQAGRAFALQPVGLGGLQSGLKTAQPEPVEGPSWLRKPP